MDKDKKLFDELSGMFDFNYEIKGADGKKHKPWQQIHKKAEDRHKKALGEVKDSTVGLGYHEATQEIAKYIAVHDTGKSLSEMDPTDRDIYIGKAYDLLQSRVRQMQQDNPTASIEDVVADISERGLNNLLESYRDIKVRQDSANLTTHYVNKFDPRDHVDEMFAGLKDSKSHVLKGKRAEVVKANIEDYLQSHLQYQYQTSRNKYVK